MVTQRLDFLRRAEWLDRSRVVAWSCIALAVQALTLLGLALWQHGAFGPVTPSTSDFVSFYAAGKLALAGTPALAYDQAAHHLMEQQVIGPDASYQYFFYPPAFLLLCAALATLPYYVAQTVFQAGSLGLFLWVVGRILQRPRWDWVAPVLAFPAVFWTVGLGQNAFLTAALFGGFTLLLERRPDAAGLFLGLLCYKPHFGVLAPVALIAGRHWRAFAAAEGTVVILTGASLALFGPDTWLAYVKAMAGSAAVYESGQIILGAMITVFGAVRVLGGAPAAAYAAQMAATVLMAGVTALVWWRCRNRAPQAAVLTAATLLAVPLALLYDQMLLLVGVAWLVRSASDGGFLPWERTGLAAIWLLSLVLLPLGHAAHVPIGPALSLLVLSFGLRRVRLAWPVRTRAAIAPEVPAAS